MSQNTAEHEKIRLLVCRDCGTIEELPDFDGPPEYDSVLEYVLSQHETNGHRHIGRLYDVEKRAWDLKPLRDAMIEQLKGGSKGLAEFDLNFYNTKDTLKEDALACYKAHLRPKEGCSEWRADRKLLRPPTKKERKEVGLDMASAPKRWLCDFCPVRPYYEDKFNQSQGLTK